MDNNWFFKFVWRINAVALLCLLCALLGLLAWEFLPKGMLRGPQVNEVINVDQADETISETMDMRIAERVRGHDLFRVVLELEQEYDYGYSSKGSYSNVINTGIFDPRSAQTVWLFETHNQLITNVSELTSTIETAQGSQTRLDYYLITFVNADTSQDLRLSNRDEKSLLMVDPTGTKRKMILNGLSQSPSVWKLKDGRYQLSFKMGDALKSVTLDQDAMQIGEISELKFK